jgi:hypothetical protein
MKSNNDKIQFLYKVGNGGAKMPHVEVWLGTIDIREIRSNKEGQRKKFIKKNIEEMVSNFDWCKFQTLGICGMKDDSIHVGDGKHRIIALARLYRNGKLNSPFVPCYIYLNATEDDTKIIFAEQDDNHAPVTYTDKVGALVEIEGEEYHTIDKILKDAGIVKGIRQTVAAKSILDCYKKLGIENFTRIAKAIALWEGGTNKYAMSADAIKMFSMFYEKYSNQIDDKILYKQMKASTPNDLMKRFENWKKASGNNRNRRYINPMIEFYNGSRKNNKIDEII